MRKISPTTAMQAIDIIRVKHKSGERTELGFKNYQREIVSFRGRGITYDPLWDDFSIFLADMGERPEGCSLDRIDNDGNYTKEN